MPTVIIDQSFWSRFPEGSVTLMTLTGINNHGKADDNLYFSDLLNQGKVNAQQFLSEEVFSQNEIIAQWRQAYTSFKTKKGARSSIEALLKRVDQNRDFLPINPLVDLYNYVSLTHAVPVGAEDCDRLVGSLRLTETDGGDSFSPLGANDDAPTLSGEVAWLDDAGAVCRCLNWREAKRTMITEDTTTAIIIMEAVNAQQTQAATTAMAELQALCLDYFGVKGDVTQLSPDTPQTVTK